MDKGIIPIWSFVVIGENGLREGWLVFGGVELAYGRGRCVEVMGRRMSLLMDCGEVFYGVCRLLNTPMVSV